MRARRFLLGLSLALCCVVLPAHAEDLEAKATDAVTAILFEYDADDFASYRVSDRGYVDVLFASNTPDALYSEMLNKLQNHPDIKSVLAGKGGPACRRFGH